MGWSMPKPLYRDLPVSRPVHQTSGIQMDKPLYRDFQASRHSPDVVQNSRWSMPKPLYRDLPVSRPVHQTSGIQMDKPLYRDFQASRHSPDVVQNPGCGFGDQSVDDNVAEVVDDLADGGMALKKSPETRQAEDKKTKS